MFELITAREMATADAEAIAGGVSGYTLMERAAACVVLPCRVKALPGSRITVVAGPGNNGGDGAVAARLLVDLGYHLQMVIVGEASCVQADARTAFADWHTCVAKVADSQRAASLAIAFEAPVVSEGIAEAIAQADLVIDALFGAGLSRAIEGVCQTLVEMINASAAWCAAIDVPSGLDGNTAKATGISVRADATITFFRYKPCHWLLPGRELCGEKFLGDIGIPDRVSVCRQALAELNHPSCWQASLPRLTAESHKYSRGYVLVRGGDATRTGAACLACAAAWQAGAGVVRIAAPTEALPVYAVHCRRELMSACDDAHAWCELLQDQRLGACVIGPANGVDDATRDALDGVLSHGVSAVIDADALTVMAADPEHYFAQIGASVAGYVLTPHAGEFERLFPDIASNGQSRWHQAMLAARRCGAVVVYKGSDTVIAHPDGRTRINNNALPRLAVAGSGDTLAGIVGSLMAQGMDAYAAASAGVFQHAGLAVVGP